MSTYIYVYPSLMSLKLYVTKDVFEEKEDTLLFSHCDWLHLSIA